MDAAGNRMGFRKDTKPSLDAFGAFASRLDAFPVIGQGGALARQTPYGQGISVRKAPPRAATTTHPLQTVKVDATHIKVLAGTVSYVKVPTIDGDAISIAPSPQLECTAAGFVVLKTTWIEDYIPRNVPETAILVFEEGDPDGDYTPASPDSITASSLPLGRVWMADGVITKVLSGPSGNIFMERHVWDNSSDTVTFYALKA